jgi:phosphatidylglycerol:prolipoprotein diacylglycerol transferase
MLPVLFNIVLQPAWALYALAVLALFIGAWQWRGVRQAGGTSNKALEAFATWTVGSAAVFFLAVRTLGDPGNQDIFHLTRPIVVPLHTYGLLVASAFLVAMQMAARAAERSGLDRERVLDLSFWILFIIVNWDEYAHDPLSIFAFWKGGLVFYGGFIGAVACSILYMRKHQMEFFPYADVMGPSVAIGQALGRLGCFSAGCCWGGACDPHFALAARFPPDSLAFQSQVANHIIDAGAATTIPIHPTQLYESIGCACIFLFLSIWRSRKRFHGELLALYLMLYAPLRATVEVLRGDEERGRVLNFLGPWARHAWWNLSTSETISVGIFLAGVAVYVTQSRRAVQLQQPAVA